METCVSVDSYSCDGRATVLSCVPEFLPGRYGIVLDRTVFFAEGGGQSSDCGLIGNAAIENVIERDGVFYHISETPIAVGNEASCHADFPKRFDKMQNHTAEHLACGIIHTLYGYENVGFHLNDDIVTFDIDGILTPEQLSDVERRCNRAVTENRDVTISYPAPDTLATLNYRAKLDLNEHVRIVTIDGYDACACCAPHVKRTGEIGLIRFADFMHYKGGMRITLFAGSRAYESVCRLGAQNRGISRLLSVPPDETLAGVKRLNDEADALRAANGTLKKKLALAVADTVRSDTENPVLFLEPTDMPTLRTVLNRLLDTCRGICTVCAGDDADGYTYLIGAREIKLRPYVKQVNEALNGRGGGSDEMLQGKFAASAEDIRSFFHSFDGIRKNKNI